MAKMSRRKKFVFYLAAGGVAYGIFALIIRPWILREKRNPMLKVPTDEIIVGGKHLNPLLDIDVTKLTNNEAFELWDKLNQRG